MCEMKILLPVQNSILFFLTSNPHTLNKKHHNQLNFPGKEYSEIYWINLVIT